MTQAPASTANWAIEVESAITGIVAYYSVIQMRADGDRLNLLTAENKHVSIERDKIRKILVMKTIDS